MSDITLAEEIAAVRREIAMRRGVYPKWVQSGRMKQDKADHEIACMESVLASLEAQAAQREPPERDGDAERQWPSDESEKIVEEIGRTVHFKSGADLLRAAVIVRKALSARDEALREARTRADRILAALDEPSEELTEECASTMFGVEDNESDSADDWPVISEEKKQDYRDFAFYVLRAAAEYLRTKENPDG